MSAMSRQAVAKTDSRPAWADEDTQEWTLAERLRYDIARVNGEHTWDTPSHEQLRAIAVHLGLDPDSDA